MSAEVSPYLADMPADEIETYHDSRQVVADARAETVIEARIAEPNAAEWERADRLTPTSIGNPEELRVAIAQELADQRARYEAIADELEAVHTSLAVNLGRHDAARRIRSVAEEEA